MGSTAVPGGGARSAPQGSARVSGLRRACARHRHGGRHYRKGPRLLNP